MTWLFYLTDTDKQSVGIYFLMIRLTNRKGQTYTLMDKLRTKSDLTDIF